MKKHFGPQAIDQKISNLLKPIFSGNKREFVIINSLTKNWEELVGKKYSKLCYPKSVHFESKSETDKKSARTKLTIGVYNSSVGVFLETNGELIIERIASFYGYKSITKIIIKQEPKQIQSSSKKTTKLDEKGEMNLAKATASIDNKDLAETLQQLGREIFSEESSRTKQPTNPKH